MSMHDSFAPQNIPPLETQLENLNSLGLANLRELHRKLFPGEDPSCCTGFLRRKIARHLQVLEQGGLPASVLARAIQIAQRFAGPENPAQGIDSPRQVEVPRRDSRLPPPGTILFRRYRNRTYAIQTLEDGFLYENRWFGSLSGIARHITGSTWNGFLFFAEALQKGLKRAS